jgi:hypothetical protein
MEEGLVEIIPMGLLIEKNSNPTGLAETGME